MNRRSFIKKTCAAVPVITVAPTVVANIASAEITSSIESKYFIGCDPVDEVVTAALRKYPLTPEECFRIFDLDKIDEVTFEQIKYPYGKTR